MRDDTINEDADVKEALRRLPEQVYNDRMFRIKRALDLSMKQQVLPKEQWTKYEEVGCVEGHEFLVWGIIYVKNKYYWHLLQPLRWYQLYKTFDSLKTFI